MKRTIVKLLLAVTALIAPLATKADVIYQDTFNYANGCIETNSSGLWICHSPTTPIKDSIVFNNRLQVCSSSAYLGVSATRQDDVHRFFTNSPAWTGAQQVLYASFIVNFTNLPTAAGAYFAHFYTNSSTFPCRIWAQTNGTVLPNTFRLGMDVGATTPPNKIYPVDLALNTDYQVVIGYCPVTSDPGGLADDSVTMWINPVSFGDAHATTTEAWSPGATIANAFAFRQASSFGGFLTVSNLVVSTTFLEAFTNGVPSTNAVAPLIVYQPTAVTSNFVGASITLSAVADGQGLGSLTYQWQIAATTNSLGQPVAPSNLTNPNGNSNIFTIDSGNAQVSDTGYYTLVVTTPYGLSTTSSVVKIVVSAAPVPPVFVTQPVSQKAYVGQTVILSTTVNSPGNVNYQWFSNNVAIVGQNASTLELDNVTTNFAASYKVAVTNDVVVNGIVSTNAVLTVVAPAQVSIAYLRTLVDPNNGYNPTNVPATIPYQVTGTITTYTNTTTGNTASYYLQDGTAGIDIFITGGSTFRPAQGDVVTFIGVLSGYQYGLELDADSTVPSTLPYTSYTDTGATNALPAPIAIGYDVATNLNNLNYHLQGSLVQLSDVYFGANAGLVLSSTTNNVCTITNSHGQSFNLTFFALDLDTAGQTLPTYASTVTGVLYGLSTNSSYSVAITKFSDINTNPVPVPLLTVLSGSNLTISWSDPLSAFYLQSSTNVVGPYDYIQGATTPFTTNITSLPMQFFRLTSQAPAPPVTN